jgi:hypothetical protein
MGLSASGGTRDLHVSILLQQSDNTCKINEFTFASSAPHMGRG